MPMRWWRCSPPVGCCAIRPARSTPPGAIRGFYVDLVFAAKTEVTVERVETEPGARTATVELVGRSPMSDDAVRTVDHFTVDDAGAITDLHVELC
jgi:hypothetical protein